MNTRYNRLAILLFTATLGFTFSSCKIGRFAYYNFANITDYKIFPTRTAVNDSVKFTFTTPPEAKIPRTLTFGDKVYDFDDYMERNNTVAFLVIKNDTLLCEKYYNGYTQESVVASFSMAKSVTSILIGCAIDDGYIASVEEPVIKYIPELKDTKGMEKLSIKNLLQMTSGIKFSESYINPFGDAATYYYGTNLNKVLYKRKLANDPGTEYSYSSGDTQMLGLVLERALKGKKITEYLQEKLWKPLGMEYDATWSLDKENGLEKTFCCINARARDFAKIGRLYLNEGNWNGKQIISKEWVDISTKPDTLEGGANFYKYQWWLANDGNYMAKGILGQYIYVVPKKDIVIVRLGKNHGSANWESIMYSLGNLY